MQLNDAQKKVVEHTDGPLLVVAGAGTGKTRVIVEKIGKLLDEGVQPEEILAVTFTEKAASEMLDRILTSRSGLLLGLSVSTFNGYGNAILKEFGVNIGIPRNFNLLSEQGQIVFFRERLDLFELEHLLPLTTNPDGIITEVLRHISRLKQLVITPEQYQKTVDELPASDEAEKDYKNEQQVLANIYKTYTELCRQENIIDYDDQIYLPIQLLEARASVRKKLQERFHTIFVDEFQDTNPMQSRLIDLLVNERQNVVVVGDDDQSIYGFRGASIANIMQFKDRYPRARQIALTQNYRSHQAILDASYNLIVNNNPHRLESTLGINKKLLSSKSSNKPLLKRFETNQQELLWIAEDIKRKLSTIETDKPVSIAVLTRSNSAASEVHQALSTAAIEHKVVGLTQDLYQKPIIRTLLELARTIAEPENNLSLHHTLISPLFNIENRTVLPLANKARYQHENLLDLLRDGPDKEIVKALETIEDLREFSVNNTVGRVLFRALEATGYKERVLHEALQDPAKETSISQLGQFFKTLTNFEKIAVTPSISQYLVSLPALMSAGENVDDSLELNENEVIVTTIHKAKGLEWDTVYIPKQTFRSFTNRQPGPAFEIPKELSAEHDDPASQEEYEKRRVMYVAVTRARKNLIISFTSKEKDPGKKSDASPLINEIFGKNTAETAPIEDIPHQAVSIDIPGDEEKPLAIPSNIFDGTTFRLSVSQAQALLTCPLNFKYKFILGTPEAPTTSTGYGSQLHDYFEEINIGRRDGGLRPLEDIIKELEGSFDRSGYSSKKQLEKAYNQAARTLKRFYQRAMENPPAKLVEYPFEVHLNPDIILHGRIDAVFDDNKGIEIVDYKTGDSVKTQERADKKAGDNKQLTMYALSWQKLHGDIPAKVTLDYVDTGFLASKSKRQSSLDTIEKNLIQAVDDMSRNIFPAKGQHDYCLHPPMHS